MTIAEQGVQPKKVGRGTVKLFAAEWRAARERKETTKVLRSQPVSGKLRVEGVRSDPRVHLQLSGPAELGRLTLVASVAEERLRQVRTIGDSKKTHPEVVVLRGVERLVVTKSVLDQCRTSKQHRRVGEWALEQRPKSHLERSHGTPPDAERPSAVIDQHARAPHDCDAGVLIEKADLPLEPPGIGDIVGIHPCDVLAGRLCEQLVERHREASRRSMAQDANASVVDAREELRGVIHRTVVEDEEFEVVELLCEQAFDRDRQVA
jgi:hypothetical protein